MANRIQLRRDTATNWIAVNPVLTQGEMGLEINTGKIKIGNGITAWNSLPYFTINYGDLTNAPVNVSDLTNDVGYLTAADLPANELPVNSVGYLFNSGTGTLSWDSTVGPTALSQLSNDIGFITSADIPAIPSDVSDLTDTGGLLVGTTPVNADWNATTGLAEILNKPTVIAIAPQWTTNHSLLPGGENTRYLAGDAVYDNGNIYVALFDNESLPTTDAVYWQNIGPGKRLNLDGRDVPNITYDQLNNKPTIPADVNQLADTSNLLGSNPFNQSLNTTDAVSFASIGAATVNASQINGTNPGNELIVQANGHNWIFGTDSVLRSTNETTNNSTTPIFVAGNDSEFSADPGIGTTSGYFSGTGTAADGVILFTDQYTIINVRFYSDAGRTVPYNLPVDLVGATGGFYTVNTPAKDFNIAAGTGNLTTANITLTANSNTWTFGSAGNLTLPAGGDIVDNTGTSVLGGFGATPDEITNTDGSNTYSVSVSTTGVVSMTTARGGLEFGAMPEIGGPQHLHIMRPAGQEGSTDLFFGDDYNYVKMPGLYGAGTQGVEIGSSYDSGPVSTWRFDTDGTTQFPNNKVKPSIGNILSIETETLPTDPPTTIAISGADFTSVNLTYINGGASVFWYPANYTPGTDPYIEFSGGQYGIYVPGFGQALYVNTGTLNIPLAQWNTNPPLGSIAPTGVYTYPNSYTRAWQFGTDSNLTLPAGGSIVHGDVRLGLNDGGGTSAYLTATTDDATALVVDTNGVQLYARESVVLYAGTEFGALETVYNEQLTILNDLWTQVSGEAGYPWGITEPLSQNTYNELVLLAPETISNQTILTVTANSVSNAWTAWQNQLSNTLVSIEVGINSWTFGADGALTLPASGTVSYTPATPADWAGTAPTTVQEAIDRLAARIKLIDGGTGA